MLFASLAGTLFWLVPTVRYRFGNGAPSWKWLVVACVIGAIVGAAFEWQGPLGGDDRGEDGVA